MCIRDRQYGIPYDHGPIIMGYNKDLFDAEGLAYPAEDWTLSLIHISEPTRPY